MYVCTLTAYATQNKTHRLSNKNQNSYYYYLIASSSSYMGYWSIFYTRYCTLFFYNINTDPHTFSHISKLTNIISHTQISNVNLMVLNILILTKKTRRLSLYPLSVFSHNITSYLIKNEIWVHTRAYDWHVIKLGLEFDLVLRLDEKKHEWN